MLDANILIVSVRPDVIDVSRRIHVAQIVGNVEHFEALNLPVTKNQDDWASFAVRGQYFEPDFDFLKQRLPLYEAIEISAQMSMEFVLHAGLSGAAFQPRLEWPYV